MTKSEGTPLTGSRHPPTSSSVSKRRRFEGDSVREDMVDTLAMASGDLAHCGLWLLASERGGFAPIDDDDRVDDVFQNLKHEKEQKKSSSDGVFQGDVSLLE